MATHETFVTKLSDILVAQKIISAEEAKAIQKAFHDSDKDQFDEFLLDEGIIEEVDLLEALAEYYQVPAFDVVGHFFESLELHKFPKELLLANEFIPLEVEDNIMIVVASNPNDPDLLEIIGDNVSYDIQFRVGIARDIADAIKEFFDKAVTEESQDEDLRQERQLSGRGMYLAEQEETEVPYGEEEEEIYFEQFDDEDE